MKKKRQEGKERARQIWLNINNMKGEYVDWQAWDK